MKIQLLPKLYVIIIAAMIFTVSANAQVIYSDILPDTTINQDGGIYALDLNNDGTIDFNISYDTTRVSSSCPFGTPVSGINITIRITPLGANEVGNDTIYPAALISNSKIDASFVWKNAANQILVSKVWFCTRGSLGGQRPSWVPRYTGRWNGATDKYIPLRLVMDSKKYYGWVRLNVPSGAASYTVKDYAYNSVPMQPLLAGKTVVTGIADHSFSSSILLFPNPATNNFTIDLGSSYKKVEVTIFDITGKIIASTSASETQRVEINSKDFVEGIYVAQIRSEDFIAMKKLVVER